MLHRLPSPLFTWLGAAAMGLLVLLMALAGSAGCYWA
jgi:hypothetical protein